MPLKRPHPLILAATNHKGGVGKTSFVVNVLAEAAAHDLHVLGIDMDKQASMTTRLGIATDSGADDSPAFNVNDVLHANERGGAFEAIIPSAWEGIDVLPSSLDLSAQESDTTLGASRRLANSLNADDITQYDLVLIDCPPSLGIITAMALEAADGVLLVTEPEGPSIKGVHQTVDSIRDFDPEYPIRGLVVNKFRGRTREHQDRLGEIKADPMISSLLWEPYIPESIRVAEAAGANQPLSALGYKAQDLRETYASLLTKIIGADADTEGE